MIILNGDQSHVTTPLGATIVGLANNGSGQVRVQTSAAHHFGDRDYVHVVTTGTVIDSYFSIAVIDATHFDLLGSTYVGTGTGTATDQSLSPAFQAPTDGDTASLQLSGMLSALQALADRTQALRYLMARGDLTLLSITASGTYVLPPWTSKAIVWASGGGGGGGGGPGGYSGLDHHGAAAGGGGAGAALGFAILDVTTPSLVVVVGAGGAGGAGSIAGGFIATGDGGDGSETQVSISGGAVQHFPGGAGGAGGISSTLPSQVSTNATAPVWSPGGTGPANNLRSGPCGSQWAPGPKQHINVTLVSDALSVIGGWDTAFYADPVGQRQLGDGGASVFTAAPGSYPGALSYQGTRSAQGYLGGAVGTQGTASSTYPGGAAGGGGGGGPFGTGGAAGDGGNANSSGNGAVGAAGVAAGANTGGGGGGGGAGGHASGTGGHGGNGGAGGSGRVWVLCLGVGA